jgi:hypothetical protein
MLGTDKSRGYCLEMICPGFLAAAHIHNGNPEILLNPISRYSEFLSGDIPRKPAGAGGATMIRLKAEPLRPDSVSYEDLGQQILRRDGWSSVATQEQTPRKT